MADSEEAIKKIKKRKASNKYEPKTYRAWDDDYIESTTDKTPLPAQKKEINNPKKEAKKTIISKPSLSISKPLVPDEKVQIRKKQPTIKVVPKLEASGLDTDSIKEALIRLDGSQKVLFDFLLENYIDSLFRGDSVKVYKQKIASSTGLLSGSIRTFIYRLCKTNLLTRGRGKSGPNSFYLLSIPKEVVEVIEEIEYVSIVDAS